MTKWVTGSAEEFLEDIMNEHVHEWKPDIYEKAYLGARCDCGETMSEVDVTARLNATERLSAGRARGGTQFLSRIKNTPGNDFANALRAYADILDGKDD